MGTTGFENLADFWLDRGLVDSFGAGMAHAEAMAAA